MTTSTLPPPASIDPRFLRDVLRLGDDDERSLGEGWHGPERAGSETFRWTSRAARFHLPGPAESIEIEVDPFVPAGSTPPTLVLEIAGRVFGPFRFAGGSRQTITADVGELSCDRAVIDVDLIASRATSPSEVDPNCDDQRPLGFRVWSARIRPVSSSASSTSPWSGSWRYPGDGSRELAGAAFVAAPSSDALLGLDYRDRADGAFEVSVLDGTGATIARHRVDCPGSGRVRSMRLEPAATGPTTLRFEPIGAHPRIIDVRSISRRGDGLNVGCGPDHHPEMINVDRRPLPGVDVVGDVTALPWRDASFGHLLANDILEHVPWATTHALIAEWARVLKPNGSITIRTPSLEGLVQLWRDRPAGWRREDGPEGIDPIVERLYGGQNYAGNFHYTIFDATSLREQLEAAGLAVTQIGPDGEDVSNLLAIARKGPGL